jgi:cytoskeleton protein RodZ
MQRLVFRLESEAWLEVRDGAGHLLVSSLNPAGTERVVQGRPPFALVIGNASRVTLTQNGRPVDIKPYIKVEVARFTLK